MNLPDTLSGVGRRPVPITFPTSATVEGPIDGTILLVIQPDTGVVVAAMVNMSKASLDVVRQFVFPIAEQSQN